MIQNKIKRNLLTENVLTIQWRIFAKEILLRKTGMDICTSKKHLLANMNILENMQINEYSKDRELSINRTCCEMDNMEKIYKDKFKRLHDEIHELNIELNLKLNEIYEISELIPDVGIATNYKMTADDTYDKFIL